MDEKLKAIKEKQENCDHLGTYSFGAQQTFEDKAKGVMVLISTLMCNNCGNLFFDQQDTTIKARVTIIPAVVPTENKENETN